jgi:hypothetical protein
MSVSRSLAFVVGCSVLAAVVPHTSVAQDRGDLGASGWQAPRTAWGDPDLQGFWSNATLTRFERPEALADKEFLTEEEAAEAERRNAEMLARADEAGPPKSEPPPVGGNVGAYNLAWMEWGTKVVGSRRTSLVVDPPDGRVPVRPEAEARRDFFSEHSTDSYEFMSVWDRCITRGMPGAMFPAGYNNNYRIVQSPGFVVILYEMIHDARIIPLDERPRLSPDLQFWNGDPRGHWEGDTLVVETTNFTPKGWIATSGSQGRIKGVPQTADLRVVERFTRVDEGVIDWRATIEDPEIYLSDWTVAAPLVSLPERSIFEYACHEGNQAVRNILRGARVMDGSLEVSDRR